MLVVWQILAVNCNKQMDRVGKRRILLLNIAVEVLGFKRLKKFRIGRP